MKIPNILKILETALELDVKANTLSRKDYGFNHNPSSASIERADGSISGECLRKLYYRATKATQSEDVNANGVMQMGFGDAIHEWILRKLQKSKELTIMAEAKGRALVDPLTREISFRLDGLVTYDGEMGGLELKTTKDRALTDRDWGIRANGPKEDHLLQVICYFETNKALKWFSLVYITRDSAYGQEYHITREGDTYFVDGKAIDAELNFKGISKRWQKLDEHIKSGIIPKRDYKVWLSKEGKIQGTKTINGVTKKSDFRCNYCPYAEQCWSGPDAFKESYNGGI